MLAVAVYNEVHHWDFERYHELRKTLTEEEALQAMIEDSIYVCTSENIKPIEPVIREVIPF